MTTSLLIDKRWQYTAAGLSVVAGLLHLFVTPEHFEEWIGYGLFFFIAATSQLLFAFVIAAYTPPARETLWAGILGNTAIIVLWVITRTVGIPFVGPEAGEIEPIGLIDSLSKVAELALIVCLVTLLRARPGQTTVNSH